MVHEKYKKKTGKTQLKTSSVNLERPMQILIKEKELNLSYIVRDLLDNYLDRNFPLRYRELKRLELEETLNGTKSKKEETK